MLSFGGVEARNPSTDQTAGLRYAGGLLFRAPRDWVLEGETPLDSAPENPLQQKNVYVYFYGILVSIGISESTIYSGGAETRLTRHPGTTRARQPLFAPPILLPLEGLRHEWARCSLFRVGGGGGGGLLGMVSRPKQARPFIQRSPPSHAHPHVQWYGVVDAALSHHSRLSGFPVQPDEGGLFSDHD